MAITISAYNHTAQLIASGTCIAGDTYKVMLLDNNASFNAAHTVLVDVSASGALEVYGNGWAQGGTALSGVSITTVTTNDASFSASNVSVTATGGNIGPAYAAVIYNDTDTNDPPLFYIAFGEGVAAQTGNDFRINWDASGIYTLNVT